MTHFGLDDLPRWARDFGLELTDHQAAQFRCYLDLLLTWNRRVALVSQQRPDEIVCKHFADSLVAASLCRSTERVADLGSGAGFPGLPIAIARPEAEVAMIEANRKKVSFLLNAIAQAGIGNARVLEGRLEKLAVKSELKARFSLVISRALSDLREFLELAAPFLAANGRAIAMKGPRYKEELDGVREARTGAELRFELVAVTPYRLPDGAERVLLSFRFT